MPCPDAAAEQPAPEPSAPPIGMARLKVIEEPETVPLNVPEAFTPLPLSVIDNVPEKLVPLCVRVHVINPGPSESPAVPDHVPATLAVVVDGLVDGEVEGEVVVELLPPPLQPTAAIASTNAATDIRVSCVKIMRSSADLTTDG